MNANVAREKSVFSCAAWLALALSSALVACDDKGASYACTCSFLTDFDDASSESVVVCASSPERAAPMARGCAQSAAPAPVQSCRCALRGGPVCRDGACEVVQKRD
jgi:hypothetical protein